MTDYQEFSSTSNRPICAGESYELVPFAPYVHGVERGHVGLAAEYRTSWSLALRQARAAELVSPAEEKRLRACPPTFAEFRDSLGWSPQPDLNSIRVPPSFAHAVMKAYRLGRITSNRALELMHGQLSDPDELPPRPEEDDIP